MEMMAPAAERQRGGAQLAAKRLGVLRSEVVAAMQDRGDARTAAMSLVRGQIEEEMQKCAGNKSACEKLHALLSIVHECQVNQPGPVPNDS
jgi:hypothetical protein